MFYRLKNNSHQKQKAARERQLFYEINWDDCDKSEQFIV
jgi:hypothetical protein